MTGIHHILDLEYDPESIASSLLNHGRRLLLVGATGSGKSTLAALLARILSQRGLTVYCISADPGSPAFGLPGSLGLARWQADRWHPLRLEALCTLDAVRFRLPLVMAVTRLISELDLLESREPDILLLDTPGVINGVAGAELIPTLAETAGIDQVLVLHAPSAELPLAAELATLNRTIYRVTPSPLAQHPGSAARSQARTELWNHYMANTRDLRLEHENLEVLGMPPPIQVPQAWKSLQVALLNSRQAPVAMGEILAADRNGLLVRLGPRLDKGPPRHQPAPQTPAAGTWNDPEAELGPGPFRLLLRDAHRNDAGLLTTRPPFRANTASKDDRTQPRRPPPRRLEPAPQGPALPLENLHIALINGVFGDPLLHVELLNRRRSLLFDLGELRLLPTRAIHQTTDILITHAHIDHICGFLTLLRARMGPYPPCRIYGPPGLAGHLQSLLNGVHWDRIGDQGPAFEVGEVDSGVLRWNRLQAGRPGPIPLGEEPIIDNVLRREPEFSLSAVTLDHGIPVLAFALHRPPSVHVREEKLRELGWPPGPWVGDLKLMVRSGRLHDRIQLPDGSRRPVKALLHDLQLVQRQPGKTLVYATDFAGHAANRERLMALAKNADLFVCESSFLMADEAQARATGHLTTRDCATLARDAQVRRLLPFHFSRRYEHRAQEPYQELRQFFPHLITQKSITSREPPPDSKPR